MIRPWSRKRGFLPNLSPLRVLGQGVVSNLFKIWTTKRTKSWMQNFYFWPTAGGDNQNFGNSIFFIKGTPAKIRRRLLLLLCNFLIWHTPRAQGLPPVPGGVRIKSTNRNIKAGNLGVMHKTRIVGDYQTLTFVFMHLFDMRDRGGAMMTSTTTFFLPWSLQLLHRTVWSQFQPYRTWPYQPQKKGPPALLSALGQSLWTVPNAKMQDLVTFLFSTAFCIPEIVLYLVKLTYYWCPQHLPLCFDYNIPIHSGCFKTNFSNFDFQWKTLYCVTAARLLYYLEKRNF